MRAFHARPFTCRPSEDKNGFFSANPKRKVLRQAHFFRWLRFHRFHFRARFSRLDAGRKRATATDLGVYRPHRQTVSSWKPFDPRCPGVLWTSTAGYRVVDLPVVVTPALEKPVVCLTSFSDS